MEIAESAPVGEVPAGPAGPAGERLAGGRLAGAVKVGDTVLRPARPWSASVQSVLRFLADAGFSRAPRALGFDEHGREVQSFLAGETIGTQDPWPDWVRSDRALIQVARWTRDLHDTTAAFVPEPGARWYTGRGWEPGLVIGHQDASPFNAVWSGADLVGFVDWESAGPCPREMDLAYVALCWVPLFASRLTGGSGVDAQRERRRRLHLLLDSYGYTGDRSEFGRAVVRRARVHAEVIRAAAGGGDPAYRALLGLAGEFEESAAEVEELTPDFWIDPAAVAG